MAYKNTDYSTSMRGDVTPKKSVMYRTENNIARPYFMRKVEQSGPDYSEPFYVEDISGSDNTLSIRKNRDSDYILIIEKSLDGKTWSVIGRTSTDGITATVPANGKLYLRCNTDTWSHTGYNLFCHYINCSSQFNVGGNMMSLLYGNTFTGEETTFPSRSTDNFNYLFYNSTTLVSAENLLLPATTLTQSCYNGLFQNCTSLTTAPALPATTLAVSCYERLFQNCTSLTTAPALPATTLAPTCYNGTFLNCTALTAAPELPAATLVNRCYESIFFGCSSLTYIKVGFTAWPSTSSSASDYRATYQWTKLKQNTTGTFVCPAALRQLFNKSGNNTSGSEIFDYTNGIPYGWTVQTF